jgi:hypothetical protein
MPINEYTRQLIIPRDYGRLDNPQAIQNAGGMAFGVSKAAGIAADYAQKEFEAQEKIAYAEARIGYKKSMIDLSEQMQQERMANPENFSNDFAEKSKELAKTYTENLRSSAAKEMFSQAAKEVDLSMYNSNLSWEKGRKINIMADSINTSAENIITIIAGGGDINQGLVDINEVIAAADNLIAPEKQNEFRQDISQRAVNVRFGYLMGQEDLKAAKDFVNSGQYDEYFGGEGILKANEVIQREEKRRQAEWEAKQTTALRSELDVIETMARWGKSVDDDRMQRAEDLARATGNPEIADKINLIGKTTKQVRLFNDIPIPQQQEALIGMEKQMEDNPTPENIFAFQQIMKSYEEQEKAIRSGNGLAWFANSGFIGNQSSSERTFATKEEAMKADNRQRPVLTPLDPSNPDNVSQVFQERRVFQQQIFDKHKIVVPMFTKDEADNLADTYNNQPLENKQAYLMSFTNNMDANEARQLASVMAKDHAMLAGIMAISKENPRLAMRAMKGAAIKDHISSNKYVNEQLVAEYGDAMLSPETINTILPIIRATYEYDLRQNNKMVDDKMLLKNVFKEMLGKKITFGNSSVMPFKNKNGEWVSRREFKALIDFADPLLIERTHGSAPYIGGKPITKEDLRDVFYDFKVVSIGDGLYQAQNNTDVLVDKDGRPFEFDFKAVNDRYQQIYNDPAGKIILEPSVINMMKYSFGKLSSSATQSIQPLPPKDLK